VQCGGGRATTTSPLATTRTVNNYEPNVAAPNETTGGFVATADMAAALMGPARFQQGLDGRGFRRQAARRAAREAARNSKAARNGFA